MLKIFRPKIQAHISGNTEFFEHGRVPVLTEYGSPGPNAVRPARRHPLTS
jgi:hypothetical protein